MQKLISFDLEAEMAVFKKPDINKGIYLTYNMLHKPALLGILGAIAGLSGHQQNGKLPDYYNKLKSVLIGIEPIAERHEKGIFRKTSLTYNNSVGYASDEEGGNLIITEQTLIKPAYRCYLLLDLADENQKIIYNRILRAESEYIPYLGKNEFAASWQRETVCEYAFQRADTEGGEEARPKTTFQVKTLVLKEKNQSVKQMKVGKLAAFATVDIDVSEMNRETYSYFEALPIGFDEDLFQYQMASFAYTTFKLKPTSAIKNLFYLPTESIYIQLH